MAGIFGVLGLPDTDRSFVNVLGQRVVFDAVSTYLAQHNAQLEAAMSFFIASTTEDYKLRYKLPGGGRLQRRNRQGVAAAVKGIGQWDIALPLEDWGAQIAGDDVSLAYMRLDELNRHLETVRLQDIGTVRYEILRRIFNSAQTSFTDELYGALLIEPAANGDAVVYSPVLGSETEATENHYLESGFASSAISDTNDPFVTMRDELEEHFGASESGSPIVTFINNAQTAKTEDLTDFDPVTERFVQPGADTDQLTGLPAGLPGERTIGVVHSCVVREWRWIPANYMLSVYLGVEPPLIQRVDPADTGLGQGLQIVSEDETYPFKQTHYRHRFGLGFGNRLNAVIMELGVGGSYSIPAAYA
jgi:hypothetical protein